MELVELVIQGLKCAPEMARIPFAKGVTALPAGERERAIARLVLDQLYPKGTEPTLADLELPAGSGRVGVVVQARDGQMYRLLLDVKTGRRALQKIANGQAESLTQSAAEIAQAVTATIGFPTEDVLRELLFSAREDLPSRRPASAAPKGATARAGGSADKPLPPGFGDGGGAAKNEGKPLPPGFEGPSSSAPKDDRPLPPGFSDEGPPIADRGGRSDDQLRARLVELDGTLASAGSIKELEFEIDGLQKRGFELDAKLRPLASLRRNAQHAVEQLARYDAVAALPEGLLDKGARLAKLRSDHERDAVRIEEGKQQLLESTRTLDKRGRQDPLLVARQDPLVKIGGAVGAGAIVLGVLGALTWEPLRWLAFLDIPSLGAAVFGGIRVLSSLEEGESVRRRVLRLDAEKKRLDDKLRAEESEVKAVLDAHGVALEQLPDIAAQLRARADAAHAVARAQEALAAAEQDGDAQTLEAEQATIAGRIKGLEEQLQSAGGGYGSIGDLEAEKAEIEAMLAGETKPAKPAEPAPTPVVEPAPAADAPKAPADDLGMRLVHLSRDVLLCSAEDVTKLVQARAGQILGALSDGRFREMRFGGRGETSVVEAAAGETIAFGALPAFDRDLTWLALKIALVEAVVKRGRLPVIFDRSLDFLADSKGPMLQKMLQFLASSTQVVSISESPALGGRPS